MISQDPGRVGPGPAGDITAGRKTFVATALAVYIALFVFLGGELKLGDWLILLALGGAYGGVSAYGADHYARTGSSRILLPSFFLAIVLAGAIIYGTAGFFLAGLILLPLASLSVQVLRGRQAWAAMILIIVTLVTAYGLRGGWEAALLAGVGYAAALYFIVYITRIAVSAREARAEMERLAAELQEANHKLQLFAIQAEELAITRERARLAHEIHDTVGHALTALDVQLELLARLPAGHTEQRRQVARQARSLVKQGLTDMRRAVAALRPAALESFSLPVAIDGLVAQFVHNTQISTDWQCEGDAVELAPRMALSLYRTVQEALTNIQRHAANTPKVVIRLHFGHEAVWVSVVNARAPVQAQQVESRTSGRLGLVGLRQRAELVGGQFEAGWEQDGGFRVMMSLPLMT